jgi:hypothetical protein
MRAHQLVAQYYPDFPRRRVGRVVTDTTDFMGIGYGDIMALGDLHYLVLGDEKERSFGIEDPKYWVKRCLELETGVRKIVKLVFYESFPVSIGELSIQCFRSPRKEARILNLVHGDPRFMQGRTVLDSAGNEVRILDIVRGELFAHRVHRNPLDHRRYLFEVLPGLLERFMGACAAIAMLHQHGENHGDIRRDHLWVESETGGLVWIDFDYTYEFHENPFGLDIFGLGNILLYLCGKGFVTRLAMTEDEFSGDRNAVLHPEDFSILFRHRLCNLRKVYPYIPKELNDVLLHFAVQSEIFYFHVSEFLEDLQRGLWALRQGDWS